MPVTMHLDDFVRWELARPMIRRIYLEQGKTLKALMEEMSRQYHFQATYALSLPSNLKFEG